LKLNKLKLSKFPTIYRRNAERGVTAVEFLIGVAALGVILLLTAPSISSMVERHYLDSTISELASCMALAKAEAERRHSTVRICPSSDGASCYRNGDWSMGWLVYSDGNSDGIPQDVEIIQAYGSPGKNILIMASGALSDSPSFTVAGMTSSQLLKGGEFAVCSRDSTELPRSKVVVDEYGEVKLVKSDSMSCRG